MFCAVRGLQIRMKTQTQLHLGTGTSKLFDTVKSTLPYRKTDYYMKDDFDNLVKLLYGNEYASLVTQLMVDPTKEEEAKSSSDDVKLRLAIGNRYYTTHPMIILEIIL